MAEIIYNKNVPEMIDTLDSLYYDFFGIYGADMTTPISEISKMKKESAFPFELSTIYVIVNSVKIYIQKHADQSVEMFYIKDPLNVDSAVEKNRHEIKILIISAERLATKMREVEIIEALEMLKSVLRGESIEIKAGLDDMGITKTILISMLGIPTAEEIDGTDGTSLVEKMREMINSEPKPPEIKESFAVTVGKFFRSLFQ